MGKILCFLGLHKWTKWKAGVKKDDWELRVCCRECKVYQIRPPGWELMKHLKL